MSNLSILNKHQPNKKLSRGFTIVELLVVIVVIGILAAITVVSYTGITKKANETAVISDLDNNSKKLEIYKAINGSYPTSIDPTTKCPVPPGIDTSNCLKAMGSNTLDYKTLDNGLTYTLTETNSTAGISATVTNGTKPIVNTIVAGSQYIQEIAANTCPSNRTQVRDARDNHTYWVKKLDDGKCWMLTNLGYAGGGTNTYSDTRTLTDGTGGSSSYTVASYYVPSTTSFTTEPTAPSTATNGTGQYGYLYNFCAANGGQTGNGACSDVSPAVVNANISICPSGWRLPTGNGGELVALNAAINGGSINTDVGLIGDKWLGQRGGRWMDGFTLQGNYGYYWSSSQPLPMAFLPNFAYELQFNGTYVNPSISGMKYMGKAVRCVAV